jgi:hypothetical protein
MNNKLIKSVVIEDHKKIKNKKITITTIVKTNKKKLKAKEVKMIAEGLLKQTPNKKIMVKVLSDKGYFTIKNYDDNMNSILDEDEYINGREGISSYSIYKVSFFVI